MDSSDDTGSESEESFQGTDSYYTDEDDEGSEYGYVSDVSIDLTKDIDEDVCDDAESEDDDEEEEEDAQCLVKITKPYSSNKQKSSPDVEYDEITDSEWGSLKALIMMADASGIAEWFSKRKVSPEDKSNISNVVLPLSHAARVGSSQIFNFLLGEGFSLNTIIHPFLEAALNHKFDIMKTLLDIGSDVNVTDAAGTTALHLVARQVTCKPQKIKFLLSNGANIDQKDKSGMTPLHYALMMGSKGTIIALLRAGASVKIKNGNGRPVLHMAVYRGMKVTALMYKAGARPDTSAAHSEVTASIKVGNANILRFLVKRNARVNAVPNITPLLLEGDLEMVNILLGAAFRPEDSKNLLDSEDGSYNKNVVRRLQAASSDPRSLQDQACFIIRDIIRGHPYSITHIVGCLPIPEVLKDYVLLKHVFADIQSA